MENNILTAEQIKCVKGLGFLNNRGTNKFNARVISENGVITAQQMKVLAQAAEKFGDGSVAFTVRMTIEVQGVPFENIQPFLDYIGTVGMTTGGTGAKVRPVVSCKGTTCVYGIYDTMGLAKEIHDRFYVGFHDVSLPHKFKISVGGCPNNCAKPDINDLGIVGQRVINYNSDICKNCKNCLVEQVCPMDAVRVENGKFTVDKDKCNNCGRCLQKCPFGVTATANDMFKIYVGGKWGKAIRMGTQLNKLFTRDEVFDVVEKSLLLFKSQGVSGERFGETIDRLGIENVEKMLESNELLQKKDKILEGK